MEKVKMDKSLFLAVLKQIDKCETITITSTLGIVYINLN